MGLIQTKCSNCGSNILIDENNKKGFCPYCGTGYVLNDDIVNNYTTNNIKIDTATIVSNEKSFKIKAGVLEQYIGEEADVIIPDTVRILGEGCFANLTGLRTVTCGKNVFKIEKNAFYLTTGLISVVLNNVQIIEQDAFNGSGIKNISLKNVVSIGEKAFYNCRYLNEITIPTSCTHIGKHAFYGCNYGTRMIIRIPSHNVIKKDRYWNMAKSKGFLHNHKIEKY